LGYQLFLASCSDIQQVEASYSPLGASASMHVFTKSLSYSGFFPVVPCQWFSWAFHGQSSFSLAFRYCWEACDADGKQTLLDDIVSADFEVVKLAIQQNGRALEDADESFRTDLEIVKLVSEQNGQALQYAGKYLKRDP